MANTTHTTRRAAIATMAGAALTAAVPASAATPFNPVPTRLGRQYLHHLALIRFLWAHMPEEGTPAYDACQERVEHHHAELKALKAEIMARPVQSVADMVDRLILVARNVSWAADDHDIDTLRMVAGALAAAGLTPAECGEDCLLRANDYVEA